VAQELTEQSWKNVHPLYGGFDAWKEAGAPMEAKGMTFRKHDPNIWCRVLHFENMQLYLIDIPTKFMVLLAQHLSYHVFSTLSDSKLN
jgi:hypothetical protein